MKIGIVVADYRQGSGHGGIHSVTDFLLAAFGARPGTEITLVSPRTSGRAPESRRLLAPRTWLRGPVIGHREINGYPVIDVGANLAEIEMMRYRARPVLDQVLSGFDVVVIASGSPALAGIARRVMVPVVLQVATMVAVERRETIARSRGLERLRLRITTQLTSRQDRRNVRVPDLVMVENPWMLEECARLGARAVELSPPGVDTDVFRPTTRENSSGYLISVCRFGDPRKDIATMLRAFSHARSLGSRHRLRLVGRGSLSAAEDQLLDSLGLRDHVDLFLDASTEELVDHLRSADLFVMSSTEEGLGLALIEALACGTPAVSTATAGASFVLDDTAAGVLVPIGDPLALGRAVHELAADDEGRADRRKAARRRAEEVFSARANGAAFVGRVEQLLESASERAGR